MLHAQLQDIFHSALTSRHPLRLYCHDCTSVKEPSHSFFPAPNAVFLLPKVGASTSRATTEELRV